MNETLPDPKETGAKAREIYQRDLKAKLEPEFTGKYVIIDVDSGDFELGDDLLVTSRAFKARNPAGRFHVLRVGHRAAGRIGFHPRR